MMKSIFLSNRLKELRDQQGLPQRKIAAALDIDAATYCKMENGNYIPRRDQVIRISEILQCDTQELICIWLANRVYEIVKDEDGATDALKIVEENICDYGKR